MSAPAATRERISLIDSLRGMALLGIASIHSLAHFGCYTYPSSGEGWGAAWNEWAGRTTCFAFENKAYLLFSFLFGLSFFLQMDSAAHRGIDFRSKFAWRLTLLFLFGLVNMLFFDGDILTIFALLGLLLIPLYKLPSKTVLIQVVKGRLFETAGLFLLGMCAGRMNLFENVRVHKSLWKKILFWALPAACLLGIANETLPEMASPALRGSVKNLTMTYWPLSYTISFVSIICLLNLSPRMARLFERLFASAGRTSLTCYISQSVFFTFLYSGWGLGLAVEMGLFLSSLSGILFFFLQAYASHLWLRIFKFGPLEWLWRSGTMLKWQPLFKPKRY